MVDCPIAVCGNAGGKLQHRSGAGFILPIRYRVNQLGVHEKNTPVFLDAVLAF